MNCKMARQAMLTADTDMLEGKSGGALAAHLAACASCAACAEFISRQTNYLAGGVAAHGGPPCLRRRVVAMVAAVLMAAGIIGIASLGVWHSRAFAVPERALEPATDVVVENSQGRQFLILAGPDTTRIVFWSRGTP